MGRVKRSGLLIALAVAALCCVVGWTGYAQRAGAARVAWEYRVVSLNDDAKLTSKLNELGSDGWELIGFEMKT